MCRVPINKDMTVAQVLAVRPEALDILVRSGFRDLANPVMRRLMAGKVTIEGACRRKGVDIDKLLAQLEGA